MDDLSPVPAANSLRQRLVEDMTVRGFSEKTRKYYIRIVAGFAAFLGRSPATTTPEDIRRFQVHQSELGMGVPAMNCTVAALRFFFSYTLDRPDLARKLIRIPYLRKLPTVLAPDEVARLLSATTCLKHRAALSVAYGAGLRVAEVASLKVGDIDSERMLIRVERGKGGRCRHALLSADLLALLRAWWHQGRREGVMLPAGWLFPGHDPAKPITTRQLSRVVEAAAQAAGTADISRKNDAVSRHGTLYPRVAAPLRSTRLGMRHAPDRVRNSPLLAAIFPVTLVCSAGTPRRPRSAGSIPCSLAPSPLAPKL